MINGTIPFLLAKKESSHLFKKIFIFILTNRKSVVLLY